MSRRLHAVGLAMALYASACGSTSHPPPPDTEIAFDAFANLAQPCGAQLTSWQVTLRDYGTTLAGSCAYQPLFQGLVPNTLYTFDIVGYSGEKVCWQGSCSVLTAGGVLTYGDCSALVQHLCGF